MTYMGVRGNRSTLRFKICLTMGLAEILIIPTALYKHEYPITSNFHGAILNFRESSVLPLSQV